MSLKDGKGGRWSQEGADYCKLCNNLIAYRSVPVMLKMTNSAKFSAVAWLLNFGNSFFTKMWTEVSKLVV